MKTSIETKMILNMAATGCLILASALLGSGCAAEVRGVDYNTASRNTGCVESQAASSCSGIRLAARNLSGSDLSQKNFASADLRFTVMNQVNATATNFSQANLSRSKLVRADLRKANLENADLSFADLRGADLRGAKLAGAKLAGADIRGAVFDAHAQVDLSRVVRTDAERNDGEWSMYGVKSQANLGVAL